MKYIYTFWVVGLMTILLSSCNENYQSDMLKIATETIYMQNVASTATIDVASTNAFEVSSNQPWLTTNIKGNVIILSATANEGYDDRIATVTVSTGSLKRYFDVQQFGQGLHLSVDQDSLSFAFEGGKHEIHYSSNNPNVQITNLVPWITIEKGDGDLYSIICAKNKRQERVGKIDFVLDGVVVKSILINQETAPAPEFILPILAFGSPTAEIKRLEEERGHKLAKEIDNSTGGMLDYNLSDGMFSKFTYMINLSRYQRCSMFANQGGFTDEQKADFEYFLVSKGFVKMTMKGHANSLTEKLIDKEVFINRKLQTKIEYMADIFPSYLCSYIPFQQVPQKSFTNPLPKISLGISKEEVQKLAEQNGYVFDEKASEFHRGFTGNFKDYLHFKTTAKGDDLPSFVIYTVYYPNQRKSGLVQVDWFYMDLSLGVFQGLDGNFYLTEELINYAQDNGFKYDHYSGRTKTYYFLNADKSLTFAVKCYKDKNMGWVLKTSIWKTAY